MVDIRIERKRKPIWPWLLFLLLLALLIWVLYELFFDRNEVEDDEAPTTGMVIPAADIPLPAYHTYCLK